MRVGYNPNKDKELEKTSYHHQVIVPIHIPNQVGYFKDSFQILQYCLESLFKTSHSQTYFTMVNNGSCTLVIDYLNHLYEGGKIHEVIHTTTIGKLNAILKGLTGHQFPLITISDADVLFLNYWQKATYDIFEAFSRTGVVCTTPSSKVLKQHTYNTIISNLFSSKLSFTKVKDTSALKMFANSIGDNLFYNEVHFNKQLTISSGISKAIVGAGHFVGTYRGSVFNKLQCRYASYSLGGNSESLFLDKPVSNLGYWRLSTEINYTCHMGNVIEPWMAEKFNLIEDQSNLLLKIPSLKQINQNEIVNFIKEKIFMRFLIIKPVWNLFLKYKGLTNEEVNNY
jgi:hypothetical protein